jgi:hypothetical protein
MPLRFEAITNLSRASQASRGYAQPKVIALRERAGGAPLDETT